MACIYQHSSSNHKSSAFGQATQACNAASGTDKDMGPACSQHLTNMHKSSVLVTQQENDSFARVW